MLFAFIDRLFAFIPNPCLYRLSRPLCRKRAFMGALRLHDNTDRPQNPYNTSSPSIRSILHFLGVGAGMIADDVIPGSEGVSFVFPCCIQFGAVQGPRVLVAPASDPKISTAGCRLWASTILTTSLPTSYNLRSPCRHRRSRTQLQPSLPPHPSLSDRSSSMPDP